MIVVLMGVSGSGKTTVGQLLAQRLGWPCVDADDYHPPANVEKMRAGIALTDEDRWPWLDRINGVLREHAARGADVILACSALKQVYRERLADGLPDVRWVYLKGSFELIQSRLATRQHRYMPASLLQSQFATLEEPRDAIIVDISGAPQDAVESVVAALRPGQPGQEISG